MCRTQDPLMSQPHQCLYISCYRHLAPGWPPRWEELEKDCPTSLQHWPQPAIDAVPH